MVKKRISHSKAAAEELGKAGVDVVSVLIEDFGRVRHGMSAVKHGEEAYQHVKKAVKNKIGREKRKFKKLIGLKQPKRKPATTTPRKKTTTRKKR